MKIMNVEILAWEEDGPQLESDIKQWLEDVGLAPRAQITRMLNRYTYDRAEGRYTIVLRIEGLTEEATVMFSLKFSNHIHIHANRLP